MDIYKEAKTICSEHLFTQEENRILAEEAIRVCKWSVMARREGLLSLECIVDKEFWEEMHFETYDVLPLEQSCDDKYFQYLKGLIEEISGGAEPDFVRKIGEITLCTPDLSALEFIQYAICLEGLLDIRDAMSQEQLERKMTELLPMRAKEIFISELM